eukprot:1151849-Pelagomonas_calceolata.AAC.5
MADGCMVECLLKCLLVCLSSCKISITKTLPTWEYISFINPVLNGACVPQAKACVWKRGSAEAPNQHWILKGAGWGQHAKLAAA